MNILSIGWNSVYDRDYIGGVHDGCLFVLARSRVRINGAILPENTLFILNGEHIVEYTAADEYLICDWVCFEPDSDGDFMETSELPFNEPYLHADAEFFSGMIANITSEFYSTSCRRMKLLDVMMRTLLMRAEEFFSLRTADQSTAEPHYGTLIELREKIYRNPQLKWNVDAMAADVSMSRSYFQHLYREIFGVSCMTDVISSKIEKAKELLSETGCTVSQVAAMCGYDNEEHFMRQFKKIVGATPTGYRKKN